MYNIACCHAALGNEGDGLAAVMACLEARPPSWLSVARRPLPAVRCPPSAARRPLSPVRFLMSAVRCSLSFPLDKIMNLIDYSIYVNS